MFDAKTQARIDSVRTIPISTVYPVRDNGTSDCPVCGGKGKFYVKHRWARCFRPTCDLSISNGGKALDIIGLYRFKHNLYGKGSFFKAIEALEKSAGIEYGEDNLVYSVCEDASDIYHSELHSSYGAEARHYLIKRGLDPAIIDTLRIGYARHDSILQQYGMDTTSLTLYGLHSKGREVFSNRIVFPVRDMGGAVKCFTGRYIGAIPQTENGDMFPRWKHSLSTMESISDYMGLEENIPIYKDDYVIVTEGYIDCLTLYQLGLQSVCIFGLHGLTKHINKLRKFRKVYAAFDIDRFPDDHPLFPKEYKSWRLVLPQLMDMQILLPDTDIRLFFIPGEGTNGENSFLCKDVNEWITQASPSKKEVLHLLDKSKKLSQYMIDTKGPDLHHHESLLRLLLSKGEDYSCLEQYIPEDFSPLDYAVALLTR